MATLVTAVLPASDVQMAFKEPFVSKSVNRKGTGIIPPGIYRGFTASALGFTVTINADGGTGDSVAVCNTINASLGPATPTDFYMGKFVQREFNFNGDFNTEAEIGLPYPVVIGRPGEVSTTVATSGRVSAGVAVWFDHRSGNYPIGGHKVELGLVVAGHHWPPLSILQR